jgi:hypothetical protein
MGGKAIMQDGHLNAVRAAAERVDETLADSFRALASGDVQHAEAVHDVYRDAVDHKNEVVAAAVLARGEAFRRRRV